MTGTVLILGAKGRFGRAATQAFAQAGWQVRAATRNGKLPKLARSAREERVTPVACDVLDREALIACAQGADVIVHAVHPLYPDWAKFMPTHTENVIAAGLASGATVMIPANVYVFGEDAGEIYDERDPKAPTTRKGRLRLDMEQAFEAAAREGLQTIILRSGDFIEREDTGNWFETYMIRKLHKGIFTYPGATDVMHAWSYLPDLARAMVGLAAKRDTLPPFSSFGFEGYSLTGRDLQAAVSRCVGRPLKTASLPWGLMRLLGLVNPLIREVNEMRYLWETPHRLNGSALSEVLPDFTPTPIEQALADILGKTQHTSGNEAAPALRSA